MTTEGSSFTINLPNTKETTAAKSDNVFEHTTVDYIINRNTQLDNENKQLRQEINELTKKLEEEENYNDSNEKKNSNMRLILKNMVESNKLQTGIIELNVSIIDIQSKTFKKLKILNNYETVLYLSFIFIHFLQYILTISPSWTYSLFTLTYYVIFSYILYYLEQNKAQFIDMNKKHIKTLQSDIKKKSEELKQISSTTDYLGDYIDAI